ncbi:PIN domain-containing protein [Nocardioides carbamazepini]|jgi:predicted nucleic acid-binding protein|uniref:type II toxin-antitoxin system VapC family toxin n=1 Tax=Nocardioides carbamazepini TaxID=2854259 RepID=UPI00214A1FBB|nr:PIN domain-containing protein [Nocardioides carbamazepini]MCR1782269.1 PIN domain-containing protein [Nocardioides carbamazepini]
MATTGADRPAPVDVVLDSNVLLAATDAGRRNHVQALELVRYDERRLAITPQIVREYLVVGTRPPEVNGLGLSMPQALGNVDDFLLDMSLLSEGDASLRWLRDLLDHHEVLGKQVHDANVVAVALAHGAGAIVTENTRHYARFAGLIGIEGLGDASA